MIAKIIGTKTAAVALALILSGASMATAAGVTNSSDTPPAPATQATQHHPMRPAHRPARPLYLYAPSGVEQNAMSPRGPERGQAAAPTGESARDAAIHECSEKANKWGFSAWQTTQYAAYGTCMSEHGQAS